MATEFSFPNWAWRTPKAVSQNRVARRQQVTRRSVCLDIHGPKAVLSPLALQCMRSRFKRESSVDSMSGIFSQSFRTIFGSELLKIAPSREVVKVPSRYNRICLPELFARALCLQLLYYSPTWPSLLWTKPIKRSHGAHSMLLLLGRGARHWSQKQQFCGLEPPWQVWKLALYAHSEMLTQTIAAKIITKITFHTKAADRYHKRAVDQCFKNESGGHMLSTSEYIQENIA